MGKFILVSGPSGSGKSVFAEQLAARLPGSRYYIATMVPCTADNHRRIEKHRLQRQGLGFVTLERDRDVSLAPVEPGSTVLLEDVSNLLANALFAQGGSAGQVEEDIRGLAGRCGTFIAVTIAGLEEAGCTGETAGYIRDLNQLNRRLFQLADAAVSMKDGRPIARKGNLDDLV